MRVCSLFDMPQERLPAKNGALPENAGILKMFLFRHFCCNTAEVSLRYKCPRPLK